MRNRIIISALLLFAIWAGSTVSGQGNRRNSEPSGFEYRNLGAFRISAWTGELAVPLNPGEKHKNTFYIAPRTGGVWKTDNRGTTFRCITDAIGTTSIGDVDVAPSNPDILWVGTGEAFNARSSYAGNGIWKSTDAGETWEHMGLSDSHHIAEIIIDPSNPDVVWVAVMGHLYSENSERGIYKTTDSGKSWNRVLYVDDATGFIDLALNPSNTDIMYASAYQKVRTPWTYEPGGEKSRVYKTEDGGSNWEKIEGGGFPDGPLGRIGIDLQYNKPDVIVAVVQNLNVKPGVDPNSPVPFDEFTDHSFDNLVGGECYRSFDGGDSWERLNDPEEIDVSGKAAYSFNKITIDPTDPDKIYIIGSGMYYTLDGGKTWPTGRQSELFRTNFGDNRTLWIDPRDGDHMFLGSDGGIYETWDGAKNMNHYHHIPLGEIYMVEVDMQEPYNIYIGLQDHEVWKAPSNSWSGEIGDEDWVIVGMWDGMYTKVDPDDSRWLYFTSQFGAHHRVDQSIGERVSISPVSPEGSEIYRFTWNTPLALSPHNSSVIYTGSQKLLRSPDRGDTWEELSPDLTYNDKVKIAGTGHIMYCTITTIDESPVKPGLIWVGTDDGRVHMTRDNGKRWTEFTVSLEKIGVPHERWVSRVLASKHKEGRAYIAKNGYRNDDFTPYLYMTDDYGKSWLDISSNLPESPVNVIYEDRINPDLLFLGNDMGVYYSIDRGKKWESLRENMPPVAVRDLLVHPREGDLVVGTYGRAAWVTDITPLQQFTSDIAKSAFHLFDIEPKPQLNFSQQASWGNYNIMGSNQLRTSNEKNGLEIWFNFKNESKDWATILITDSVGKEVFKQEVPAISGIKKIYFNTMFTPPGKYKVVMTYNGENITKEAIVKERWLWPVINYREQ
jgi:photosystem II stability/assembly factor-like uncharacterized protein